MINKLYKNQKFIFIFTFVVEFIIYLIFNHLHYGGEFIHPDIGLAPIFGLMFGPIGALGQCSAILIFQIFEGTDIIGSLINSAIMFFVSVVTFKLWYSTFKRKSINTPKFNSTYNILKFLAILIISSIIYLSLINISIEAYSNMYLIYPMHSRIYRISYVINMFNFSIFYGLLLISIFNIKKIPMKSPEKWHSLFDIKNKYFVLIFIIFIVYVILARFSIINYVVTDNIFFAIIAVTAILFSLNKFDVSIKVKTQNYSILEQIIIIFLVILAINLFAIFNNYLYDIELVLKNMNINYIVMITFALGIILITFLCIFHIRYIEKLITNPIYDLIEFINKFEREEKFDEDSFILKFKKYLKKDDDISRLIKSFILLSKNIKVNLINLKKTVAEKEKIETELSVASNIQSGMLKTNFDEFSKNRPFEIYGFMNPAKEVGGDFYDFFDIDEENIAFVIGDISGKGMPATLFMVKTMYLIRNHAKFDFNLEELFENVNNLICMRNDEELFVTSWFGKLNLKNGRLKFVNAGHNQPLINSEYLTIKTNFILGGLENTQYREHEIDLNPGDMIFLYTDGITEANNNYNGFYGKNRLKGCIVNNADKNLKEIVENLKKDIYSHCGSENKFDDMTMLAIKYNGCESNDKS